MAKRKTLASIDRQIEKTKQQLQVVSKRYERLSKQLQALHKEREARQGEILAEALAKSSKSLDDVLTFLGR